VICSDCGGGREVVQGHGRLFPLGDASALAERLIHGAEQVARQADLARFSDEAARVAFWALPMVHPYR